MDANLSGPGLPSPPKLPRPPWNRGQKVWEWTIISPVRITGRNRTRAGYRVECSCSTPEHRVVRDIHTDHLQTGNTKSCGHVRATRKPKPPKPPRTRTLRKTVRVRIGYTEHVLIRRTWNAMVRRCHDPQSENYQWYGGRGIEVCPEWRDSCEAFETWVWENLWPRPDGHSLDRIDNDGNYEPVNVRWADRDTQAQNSRPAIEARARREEATRAKAAEKQARDESRKAAALAKAAELEAEREAERAEKAARKAGRALRWHEMNKTMTLSEIARRDWVSVANVSTELRRHGYAVVLHNGTGYPGVKKVSRGKRTYYVARVTVGGERKTLGQRKTPREAYELILAAEAQASQVPADPAPQRSEGSHPKRRRSVAVRAA